MFQWPFWQVIRVHWNHGSSTLRTQFLSLLWAGPLLACQFPQCQEVARYSETMIKMLEVFRDHDKDPRWPKETPLWSFHGYVCFFLGSLLSLSVGPALVADPALGGFHLGIWLWCLQWFPSAFLGERRFVYGEATGLGQLCWCQIGAVCLPLLG